jgi:hypothetical protein
MRCRPVIDIRVCGTVTPYRPGSASCLSGGRDMILREMEPIGCY